MGKGLTQDSQEIHGMSGNRIQLSTSGGIWFFPFDCVKTVYKREKPKELCFSQLGFEWQRFSWRRHKARGRLKEGPLL